MIYYPVCPKCGGHHFDEYEYVLIVYKNVYSEIPFPSLGDLYYSDRETIDEVTKPEDRPYVCKDCEGEFDEYEIKFVLEESHD